MAKLNQINMILVKNNTTLKDETLHIFTSGLQSRVNILVKGIMQFQLR